MPFCSHNLRFSCLKTSVDRRETIPYWLSISCSNCYQISLGCPGCSESIRLLWVLDLAWGIYLSDKMGSLDQWMDQSLGKVWSLNSHSVSFGCLYWPAYSSFSSNMSFDVGNRERARRWTNLQFLPIHSTNTLQGIDIPTVLPYFSETSSERVILRKSYEGPLELRE
jgi:hypothetical protein